MIRDPYQYIMSIYNLVESANPISIEALPTFENGVKLGTSGTGGTEGTLTVYQTASADSVEVDDSAANDVGTLDLDFTRLGNVVTVSVSNIDVLLVADTAYVKTPANTIPNGFRVSDNCSLPIVYIYDTVGATWYTCTPQIRNDHSLYILSNGADLPNTASLEIGNSGVYLQFSYIIQA